MKDNQNFEKYAITHEMKIVEPHIKEIIKNTIKKRNKRLKILDYGAGDGGLLKHLEKYTTKQNIKGTEISKIRTNRIRKKGYWCQTINKNKPKICTPNNHFDYITMIEVIEHIPQKKTQTIIKELKRVLKPKGKLIITTPNYPIKRGYDWLQIIKGKPIIKAIKDDPTHVTKYNQNKLKKELQKEFKNVEIHRTYIILEHKKQTIKELKENILYNKLAHKIYAINTKEE